nr:MAG TPA: hypothetical protein [Caudoviricetes sp.]
MLKQMGFLLKLLVTKKGNSKDSHLPVAKVKTS